jgi:multiple sugar transport system ATP-binding protein
MAMVFQSYALYPHMRIYENLASGLKLKKAQSDEIQRRVTEVAKLLGLEELLQRKPGKLSGDNVKELLLVEHLCVMPKSIC